MRIAKRLFRYREMNRRNIDDLQNWTGRWMPDREGDPTPPPKVWPKERYNEEYESVTESFHGIHHGVVQAQCDDGKVGIVHCYRIFLKDPNVPVTEYSMYFNSDKISD